MSRREENIAFVQSLKDIQKRVCLRCGKKFNSQHKHNRICPKCADYNANSYHGAAVAEGAFAPGCKQKGKL